jgi:hypothetical protein
VDVEVTAKSACERLSITVYAQDESAYGVFDTSTERLGLGTFNLGAGESFRCSVQLDLHLAPGMYHLGVALIRYDVQWEFDRWFPAASLVVAADRDARGVANLYPKVVVFEPAGGPPPDAR